MSGFNKHVFFSALTVLLLAVLVCFRFFGDILLHPDEFLFGETGDGLKNYYTIVYQVLHGEGTWFNGMLYPYGDHLMFADGQPLLAKVLSFFVEPNVANGPQIVGIMNLLMILSLVVTAWCVHRLLVWNFVNPWFAVPFSLTIAFLSPQLARFVGHYALAYTFFVPMSWLLIESLNRFKFPWVTALITSTIILAFGFLHPYYLFIFVLFIGAILGWELLIKRFKIGQVKNWAARSFAMLVPLIVFIAYQKWADPYMDRPTSPSGTFSYMATFQSVFVPVTEPFYSLFNSYFFRIFIPTSWEGHAYIGMVASFTAFASVLAMGKRIFKRKLKTLSHPVLPATLKRAFIPGILTLLFAMGMFHNLGLYWLSDYIALLKQFRSLGRMAWIFYYVFSVWTVYHLHVLFRHFRSVNKGKYTYHISIIVGLCAFLWMLDAIVNIKANKASIMARSAIESFSDNYLNQWENSGVNLDDYQAILPLPMPLIGSEKIGLETGHHSLLHSMRGSISTGLPIIGGAMSRTSLEVTEKTAQLVANPLFPRKILDDLDPDKKLLFLCSNENLKTEEQRLSTIGEVIFENSDYRLISTSIVAIREHYGALSIVSDSLPEFVGSPYSTPLEYTESSETLWGQKAFRMNPLDDILDTVFNSSETMVLSYWVKIIPEDVVLPNRVLSIDGEWKTGGGIGNNPNIWDGWLMVRDSINTQAGKQHKYVIQARPGTISRILLRKSGDDVLHSEGDQTFYNNIPLR